MSWLRSRLRSRSRWLLLLLGGVCRWELWRGLFGSVSGGDGGEVR